MRKIKQLLLTFCLSSGVQAASAPAPPALAERGWSTGH